LNFPVVPIESLIAERHIHRNSRSIEAVVAKLMR
jgi:hypothetical protein